MSTLNIKKRSLLVVLLVVLLFAAFSIGYLQATLDLRHDKADAYGERIISECNPEGAHDSVEIFNPNMTGGIQ